MIATNKKTLSKWILIVSGIFALLEIMVSVMICISPEAVLETVDFNAKGINYLVYMWASRQFALGVIFAVATWKRSAPMLTLAYTFFLVMFIGDFVIGAVQHDRGLMISAVVMSIFSAVLLIVINKKK